MLMLILFRLLVTLSDCVKQAMDLTTGIETRDNVLDWRLQQSHNIGNKFVLALDGYKLIEFVSANKEALFSEYTLQCRNLLLFVLIVLQQLSRSIGHLGEHQCSIALKAVIQSSIVEISFLECFVQQRVLYNKQLNVVLETIATKSACLLCIQTRKVNKIEVRILLEFLTKFYDNSIF